MSRFWSGIEDERSSKMSWGKLAYRNTAGYAMHKNESASCHYSCYQPSEGCDPYYLDTIDYAQVHQSVQYENEHFCSPLPTYSSSMDHLTRRLESLEARKYEKFAAPESSNQVEVSVCAFCGSTKHSIEHCLELHAFRQSRVYHDNTYYPMQGNTPYPQPCDLEYRDDPNFPWEDEQLVSPMTPRMESMKENLKLLKQNSARLELKLINAQHEEYQYEIFDYSSKLNSDFSVVNPDLEHDNNYYLPTLEEDVEAVDTNIIDGVNFSCFWDDDHDMVLEEVVNEISEFCNSEILDHNVETSNDNVSFDRHTSQSLCKHDLDTDLGIDNLFNACENDTLVVYESWEGKLPDGADKYTENDSEVSVSLPMSQTDDLAFRLEFVCTNIVNSTFLRDPILGLELCASQIPSDYFAAKYDIFEEPQLECTHVSQPVHNRVHLDLRSVHAEPPYLLNFVSRSMFIENFRFGGSSFRLAVSLAFLSCYVCVRPLFIHIIFWVDPQLFRLLVYGKSFV